MPGQGRSDANGGHWAPNVMTILSRRAEGTATTFAEVFSIKLGYFSNSTFKFSKYLVFIQFIKHLIMGKYFMLTIS